MIIVRFPTGFSIQYNDLDYADIRANGTYLGKKATPNSYSAFVPLDCVVEHIRPCRTYNAATEDAHSSLLAELAALRKEVRSLTRKTAKRN